MAVESERLALRAHTIDDFEACRAMWADPLVTRYIGGRPSSGPQTWQRILAYLGHWKAMGYGYWAVEEKRTGKFIGEIGFADFKRDIDPAMQNVPELGFALIPSAHGKGFASEAVSAALTWGDEHLPSRRTVALANSDNAASLRILRKAGYDVFQTTVYNGAPVAFLERIAR